MTDDIKKGQQADGRLTVEQPASIWTRNFSLLCLANLALYMSMHLLLPTLPIYLFEIGGDQRDVGYLMGAFTIGTIVMRLTGGWLVDSYGRKKILTLGLVMVLAVSVLYKLATDVPLMMMIRAFHGMTYGLVGTAIGTVVADSLPTARLAEGMGYFGLTTTLSMSLAPVIGFWLVGESGYPMLFLTVILLTMLSFFCSLPVRCSLTVRGTNAPISTPASYDKGIWAGILEKTALPASKVVFFPAIVHGSVFSFIALYAAERGITNIGLFFTAYALTMFFSRPVSGRWTDRGGADMVILIGHLALFIGMTAIGLSRTIMGFLFAGAVLGLGYGFLFPTLQAMAVRHAPAHRRGAATGTLYVAFDLGLGLGTILWGYVAAATGYQIMFFTTLVPLALAGVIYYRDRVSRQPDHCQKQGAGPL